MVISTITRKNNTSAIVAEKYLSDLDVNQILDVVQDGTKDLNTNTVICQGNNLFVNVNKGVRYNVTLSQMEFSNDGTVWNVMGGNPTVISVLAGEPISIRDACYIGTDGKAYKSTGSKCEGVATSTAVLNAPIELQTSGSLSGFTGLTVGSTYYADNTIFGGITNIYNNIKIGVALTNTSLFIDINNFKSYGLIASNLNDVILPANATRTKTLNIPPNSVLYFIDIRIRQSLGVSGFQGHSGLILARLYKTVSAVNTDILPSFSMAGFGANAGFDSTYHNTTFSHLYFPTPTELSNGFDITIEYITDVLSLSNGTIGQMLIFGI